MTKINVDEMIVVSPARYFGVNVSDNQVRRFLSGELHAEENFESSSKWLDENI